jgi:cytochrome c554/c'-like protein
MVRWFGHAEHLVRVLGLFAAGVVAFAALRAGLVPEGFGRFGHYRAGALDDARARTPAFAGRAACLDCHADAAEAAKGSGHARVRCEACHGPLAAHAGDPAAHKAVRPDARVVCARCHQANVARPARFPQKDIAEHAGDEPCTTCHVAHHPAMGGEEAKAP